MSHSIISDTSTTLCYSALPIGEGPGELMIRIPLKETIEKGPEVDITSRAVTITLTDQQIEDILKLRRKARREIRRDAKLLGYTLYKYYR